MSAFWSRTRIVATRVALCLGAAGLAAAPGAASAQSLRDNRFALDLFQGPILAPIGILGLGGAYAGYAEGISGMVSNAAAPAVREPFSVSHFDYDATGSISIPIPIFSNNDFDNSGSLDFNYSNFIYGTLGGVVQYGALGAGFNLELQRYALTDARGATTAVVIGKYHLLAGVRLIGDQLMIGAGARLASLNIDAPRPGPSAQAGTFGMFGAAPELGFLIRPDWQPFRFGGTLRLPVDGGALAGGAAQTDTAGVQRSGGLILPQHVILPWEIELGSAVQVGPRPLNPRWLDPRAQEEAIADRFRRHRAEREAARAVELARIDDPAARARRTAQLDEAAAQAARQDVIAERRAREDLARELRARDANWPRAHLLLTADLLITGPVDRGVGIQGFLGQTQRDDRAGPSIVGRWGAAVNFSPRIGVEAEPVPGLVHTRLGSYYEPSRGGGTVGRQHFTFGADMRIFTTTWFGLVPEVAYKLQASADLAPRYQSVSLGAGVWH